MSQELFCAIDRALPNIAAFISTVLKHEQLTKEAESLRLHYEALFNSLQQGTSSTEDMESFNSNSGRCVSSILGKRPRVYEENNDICEADKEPTRNNFAIRSNKLLHLHKGLHLTVCNIVNILQQVRVRRYEDDRVEKWRYVGVNILNMSSSQLEAITERCNTDGERLEKIIEFWLKWCPYASWRSIIWYLDSHEHELADFIGDLAEPVSDPSLTSENVLAVLTDLDSDIVSYCCNISDDQLSDVFDLGVSQEAEKETMVKKWLAWSPFATWEDLAGELCYYECNDELELMKKYLSSDSDPTLTVENLTRVVEGIRNMDLLDTLLIRLNFDMTVRQVTRLYPEIPETANIQALMTYFLENHPAPSWTVLAYAMYMLRDTERLKVIQTKYVRNYTNSLQSLCVRTVYNSVHSSFEVDKLPLPERIKSLIKY